jgi:RES domain-containing protein
VKAWRVVRDRKSGAAFTGRDATRFGARWNKRGHRTVYLASHLSLAVLEILAGAGKSRLREKYIAIPVEIPDDVPRERVDVAGLPQAWQSPRNAFCAAFGTAWLEKLNTAILDVPSAVLPLERNFIANPQHPDFGRFNTSHPGYPLRFDDRLVALIELH